MKYSLVVINYQNQKILNKTIGACLHIDYVSSEYEIIFVDDGSQPPLKYSDDFGEHQVKHLYLDRNSGSCRSIARNRGARIAEGEYLVFVDGDCLIGSDLLLKYDEYFDNHPNREIVLGSYCHLVERDVPELLTKSYLRGLEEIDEFNRHDCRFRTIKINRAQISSLRIPWIFFISRNFCVSKRLFDGLDGFCEEFKGWGSEDTELGYRFCKFGCDFDLIQNRVYHISEEIEHGADASKYQSWLKNIGLFYKLHEDPQILLLMLQEKLIYDCFVKGLRWHVDHQINVIQSMLGKAKRIAPVI